MTEATILIEITGPATLGARAFRTAMKASQVPRACFHPVATVGWHADDGRANQ